MRMNRRNVLLGLGTAVAGGGAALGTGAFSQVEADRDVTIELADDSSAYLQLEAVDENSLFVTEDEQISFNFDDVGENYGDGLNKDAISSFDNLFEITNQGTTDVEVSYTADEGITLYTGSVSDNSDSELNAKSLTANESGNGESVSVGLQIDTNSGGVNSNDTYGISIIAAGSTQ